MSDNDKALTFRSKPCPLCGAKPHHGLTKVKHCQLHGDPYQNFRIWCPHGCCQVECGDGERARAKWDNRPNENADSMSQHCPNCEAQAAEIERLKAEVKNAWCDDALPCRQLMDAKQEIERLRDMAKVIENPDRQLCCSGDDCGCQGSTVGQWAAWCMSDCIDRIEAQAAEIERLKGTWEDDAQRYVDNTESLYDEIERLREAGTNLRTYAAHDDGCASVQRWQTDQCNCGYTEAWQAWHSLAGKAEQ